MIHVTSQLSNALLATGSLKSLLDSGKIYLYSGPVPATADEAIDASCVLLDTITAAAGAGVTFDGAPVNGVLKKTAAETWSGTAVAAGTASFYRLCVGTDNGSALSGAGGYRVQGTVGTDASYDMVFSSTTIAVSDVKTLNTFQLQLPL